MGDRFIPPHDRLPSSLGDELARSPWRTASQFEAGAPTRRRSLASSQPWIMGSASTNRIHGHLLEAELVGSPGPPPFPMPTHTFAFDGSGGFSLPAASPTASPPSGGLETTPSRPQASPQRVLPLQSSPMSSASGGSPLRDALRDSTDAIASHSLSHISDGTRSLLSEHRKPRRKISRVPFKVLDAPKLVDDFYLNLLSWSCQNVLAVGLAAEVYMWNGFTSKVEKLADFTEPVGALGWSDRGAHLAVGGVSGYLGIYDVATGKEVRSLKGHVGRVGAVTFAGHLLASGGRDKCVYIRDVRSSRDFEVRLSDHVQDVCGLKWSPDWTMLASGANDNKVAVWHTSMLQHDSGMGLEGQRHDRERPLWRFTDHKAAAKALAWSPHEAGILATGGGTNDKCIRVYSTSTGEMLQCVDTGAQVCSLNWSINTNEIASTHGYTSYSIAIWKYPSMLKLANLTGHQQRVIYSALSPDGQTIATGAGDETLRFWSIFPALPKSSRTSPSVLMEKIDGFR